MSENKELFRNLFFNIRGILESFVSATQQVRSISYRKLHESDGNQQIFELEW